MLAAKDEYVKPTDSAYAEFIRKIGAMDAPPIKTALEMSNKIENGEEYYIFRETMRQRSLVFLSFDVNFCFQHTPFATLEGFLQPGLQN